MWEEGVAYRGAAVTAYEKLERTFARIDALEGAAGILDWDARTTMPSGAAETRGEQMAALKGTAHAILVDDRVADLVQEAGEDRGLGPWQQANLREMRRLRTRAVAVPGDLVEACERAVSRSEMAWRSAREAGDFAAFLPTCAKCSP